MSAKDESRESGTSQANSDNNQSRPRVEPWKDAETLRELYWGEELSQSEIGDRFDISQNAISYWMDELGVETRPPMHEREREGIRRNERDDFRTQYHVDNRGGSGEDEIVTFYESNLVALHEEHAQNVFNDDTDTHHRLGSPLHLNLPSNLEVLGSEEHQRAHAEGTAVEHPTFILAEMDGEDDALERPRAKASKLRRWRERIEDDATMSA